LDNLFSGISDTLLSIREQEQSDVLLKSENIRIERIISQGQTSPAIGWYDQTENEWVSVLKGEAIIEFEDKKVKMVAGSYIHIPAHTRHKVSWTSMQEETVWLAIFY